jgi:hypothetical protein
MVSTGMVFAFTYICAQYLHLFTPPTPFSHHLLSPTVPLPPVFLFHLCT